MRGAWVWLGLALLFTGCDDGAPEDWESVESSMQIGSVTIEHVTYRSGSLLIHGQVCRPTGEGWYPLVV